MFDSDMVNVVRRSSVRLGAPRSTVSEPSVMIFNGSEKMFDDPPLG